RQRRDETGRDEPVEREPVDGERDASGVPDEVAEPGTGDLRRPLHLESAELEVIPGVLERGRLAPPAQLDSILLRIAVGNGLVRRVRDAKEQLVALGGRGLLLRLEPPEVLLHLLELLDLLGRRLAGDLLPRAELVDLRNELAPAGIRGEELVEELA